jgi:hypothetical protein
MKVSDFEVCFGRGSVCFTCCMGHILGNDEPAFENMEIECDECGATLVLKKVDGKLMWFGKK